MLNKIWEKSRLNDTLIAGLISYAGFGTFFPKFINGFASLNGTSDFETLTWFGMGYFLLPAFLFLAYWNSYEFRKVIADKLKPDNPIPSIGLDVTIFFVILKLIPVFIFFFNTYFLYEDSYLWVIIYAVIGVFEFLMYGKNVKEAIFDSVTFVGDKEKKAFGEMLQYGLLISFLNLFLGIGMLYFVEPWFLYRDNMIFWLSVGLMGYALVVYSFYLYYFYEYNVLRNSHIFNVVPIFLFLFLIYLLPHVNRSLLPVSPDFLVNCSGLEVDIYFLFFVSFLVILIKYILDFIFSKIYDKSFNLFNRFSVLELVYFLFLIGVFCFIPYILEEPLGNKSRSYFEKRVKAANEITDKKLIPQIETGNGELSENDRTLFRFVHRNNHFLRMYWDWKKFPFSDPSNLGINVSCEKAFYDIPFQDSEIFKNNLSNFTTARNFFYGQYGKQEGEGKKSKSINEFYSDLFYHLKCTVFPKTIIPLAKDRELRDTSNYYTHPLNYYSYVVNHYSGQVSKVDSAIHNLKYIEYLNRIDSTEDQRSQILGEGTNVLRKAELVADVQHTLEGITEFMYKKSVLSDDDILTSPPVKGFEYFKNFKQEQFYDRIRSAQVIYQSYLYDYQRVGVFLFLLQIVVLGFTWYRINQDFVPAKVDSSHLEATDEAKPKTNTVEKSSKADDHAVAIAFIIVFALLFPLMREIKAENIDPQKKFWMLNLSNWYMPSFVLPELPPLKAIEEEKKKDQVSNSEFDNSVFNIYSDNSNSIPPSTVPEEKIEISNTPTPDLIKMASDINEIKKLIVNER
ncbi:hypothetical protein [Algoriphagus namhaensis]